MVNHDKPKVYQFELNSFNNGSYYTWNESKQSNQFIILNYKEFNKAALKTKAGVIYNNTYYKKGYPSLVNKEYDGNKKGIGKTLHIVENTFKELNYHFKWTILNTKEHGIPQNRERIYIVGFRDIKHHKKFEFRKPIELKLRLIDMLEDDVDEGYNLKEDAKNSFMNGLIKIKNGIVRVREAVKAKYTVANIGDGINLSVPSSETRRGRVGIGVAQTLDCACNQAIYLGGNLFKKYTPRMCVKLQGFDDDFKFNVSETQIKRQMGNSMSANITDGILNDICVIFKVEKRNSLF